MPARFRLYQYAYSPYCIPIEMVLRHSGMSYEVVDLPVGDPTQVIALTQGRYYQVPVLQDLFSQQIIFDQSPAGDDIPRFLNDQAPLMKLFPAEVEGLHRILLNYIENDCEARSFKVCDAYADRWLKNDVEHGLLRRHKERKFGPGCMEEWAKNVNQLIEDFYRIIQPFENMLGKQPFLTGEHPVFADYALYGVLGNFLFPGNTQLPANYLMIEAWVSRMRVGKFKNDLDDIQLASQEQFNERADQYGKNHILADVSDLEKVFTSLKLRPGGKALDVATGNGHTAIFLAKKGMEVTACDISTAMLQQALEFSTQEKVHLELYEHSAEQMPYADDTFNLVTCRVAAHHFSAPDAFIRESERVLKHYGHMVVIDAVIPDDQAEVDRWLNTVEKLRDPSHVRLYMPMVWKKWCAQVGLNVSQITFEPFKMKDLNWYFNVANTPVENRKKILEMIAKAPASVREILKIGQEDGKIIWYWRRMTLVAGKL